MARTRQPSTNKNPAAKAPIRKEDKWSAIENGTASSASKLHYKESEPKKRPVNDKKVRKLHDGFSIGERVLSHPPQQPTSGKKRPLVLEAPPKAVKKAKAIDQTIDLTESPYRKSIGTTLNSSKQQKSNGVQKVSSNTVVLDSDSEIDEEEMEDEMDGLESGEDEEEEEEEGLDEVEKIRRRINGFVEHSDEEDEEEEEGLDEEMDEEEGELDEDEAEIDLNEMQLDPNNLQGDIVPDDPDLDEEEDEEEMDEEEDEEESEVSDMELESDHEGFIAGEDRETLIIQQTKSASKKRHSQLANKEAVDFDAFPFTNVDSVVTATRAFGFMISSCDVQTFFQDFYQSKVLVVRRNQPNYYGNLFSTQQLSELMETNNLEYGVNINIAEYKNGQRTTLNGTGRVYPQIVKQHLSNLRSVQFVNPQTFDNHIWYLCEILQELFGCFVGANTYLTPAGSSGFAPHWDEIDAFLLQVEGRKYWRVWGPKSVDDELPLESSGNFTENDMKGRKPVFEGWIEQGDMLYIPRGFIHQARTDEKVHSLHVTISTGRRWSFADMMQKVVPQAVEWLTDQRMKMRRGLPIGLLDMGGAVDLEYPQAESFAEKFQIVFDRHMSMLRNFVADSIGESSVDIMAKEFMKQALPPLLTEEEKTYSVIGKSTNLLDDDLVEFNAKTKVRLLRKHTQRLLMESENECFLAHRLNNSRQFEGKPEQLEDFPSEGADVYTVLSDAYPEWRTLDQVFSSEITQSTSRKDQLAAIQRLYQIGVLLVKN